MINSDLSACEWYQDLGELVRLLEWLDKHDEFGPLLFENVLEILKKPWHWDPEYRQMCGEERERERTTAR